MTGEELGEEKLPPRSKLHASDRSRWSRRFYGILVGVFTTLIVGLIVWSYLGGM